MDWKTLQGQIPTTANPSYDWKNLCALIPALNALEHARQDPRHHGEIFVGLHTRMVLDALLSDVFWQQAPRLRQIIMFLAALLHDLAKPATTVVDPVTGAIGQPGHSQRGAVDVRILLWYADVPFEVREAVCRIVATHQVPFFAFNSRRGQTPEYIVRRLSWESCVADLACVARADMTGRICADQASHLADIELFEELAREEGCWMDPWQAADAHTRLMYARGMEIDPRFPLYKEEGSEVEVLCGPPASGKTWYVSKFGNGRSEVSFDEARGELGLPHGKNDGMAAHYAIDKAKALLRKKEPFIWNATHLSTQMRNKTLDLLYAYKAKVKLVYLEAPADVIFARNSKRDSTLSNKDLADMLLRWETPLPWEAHEVAYLVE